MNPLKPKFSCYYWIQLSSNKTKKPTVWPFEKETSRDLFFFKVFLLEAGRKINSRLTNCRRGNNWKWVHPTSKISTGNSSYNSNTQFIKTTFKIQYHFSERKKKTKHEIHQEQNEKWNLVSILWSPSNVEITKFLKH